MRFEFNNYKLRKSKMEDADALLKITHDKEVMRYHGTSGSFLGSVAAAKAELNWFNNQFSNNAGRFVITETARDEYIGDIGFFNFIETHNRVELGYKLKRAYWGQGIITGFIGILLKWGFSELSYNRVEALVDPRNEGSKIVLTRNHFSYEGTLRDYEFEHGHFVDVEMYSILKKDIKMEP